MDGPDRPLVSAGGSAPMLACQYVNAGAIGSLPA
jgi:hypothetical protein